MTDQRLTDERAPPPQSRGGRRHEPAAPRSIGNALGAGIRHSTSRPASASAECGYPDRLLLQHRQALGVVGQGIGLLPQAELKLAHLRRLLATRTGSFVGGPPSALGVL